MKVPLDIGPIHFIGIGGIGMSGIAEIMHNLGYKVQGSDISQNANVKRLQGMGIKIAIGHDADNLTDAAVVVISSAIQPDNSELKEARKKSLPVVRRAEMLAELMRLKSSVAVGGTHGKTTTTSLLAAILDAADYDPTIINGGIINAYGTNARLGAGEWMVVEADESDGSFVKLPATIAIVTNIDPEHLDYYGDFDVLKKAFLDFVENVPFYGFVVLYIDHPEVQALAGQIKDRRIVSYGKSPQAKVRLDNFYTEETNSIFDLIITGAEGDDPVILEKLSLPMPGLHNVLNATAAVATALEMGISASVIRKALAGFGGVKRRFSKTGIWNGVSVFDDYGHHPVEIAAVLSAAREISKGRVIAVVQPHRYTRLYNLFEEFCSCFNDADTVIVAPVYEAGEQPIKGADRDGLVAGLLAHGHQQAVALAGPEMLAGMIRELAQPGDIVICLGAGTITQWAHALPGALAKAEDV